MFHAVIIACALAHGQCTAFQDTYGPYETEAECRARLDAMTTGVEYIISQHGRLGPYRFERFCKKEGEQT